ncbi:MULTISPECIES: ribulokinase [unclassified Kitasatospora]|uniref:ribulokinase n=1 Tax=Kitasatospora sp. Root107 TaxID=1736424 RepID=UPI00070C6052|nr:MULTISPECIES: ribulokinase [unclassified Kitasatospora]KQV13909.1 ribulokinase [Kitasatospora sp. Root107]KRB68968.1 ribulokinase [Kitasatospora sp. Root187]
MNVPSSPEAPERYVVGVDFGTLSGRAVVVRVRDGEELGTAVHEYPHGVIEHRLPGTDALLPPDWALQHPEDWREVLRTAVPAALAASGVDPAAVIGIATDFTACTVLPVRADGTPLAETELAERPHAWPKLWKHHAAQGQADRINELAHQRGEKWISRYGGKISAEWQFAKALQLLEEDPAVYAATERWIEAADWIVWQLTGAESRNTCTAGYKGILQDGSYPSEDYLAALHPDFADFARTRLEHPLAQLGSRVGSLNPEAAGWTGLPEGIAVAAGNVDAHVAAPAAQAVENGQLLAIMGTSTCHVVNGATLADVPGICGVVEGGIVQGAYGYEAGQSAVGDIFAWWLRQGLPADYLAEAEAAGLDAHQLLTDKAAGQPVGGHGLVALDWLNGNRSTLVDHHLSGVIVGLTLATRPEEIYRALLESTAYGTRTIVEALEQGGVPVTEFIVTGGLKKNALLMQIYADVLRRPVSLAASAQGPALGSAIHAAVAAGAHPDVRTAAAAMGRVERSAYLPDPERADAYDALFAEYAELHRHFGTGADKQLHRLRRIRNTALTQIGEAS